MSKRTISRKPAKKGDSKNAGKQMEKSQLADVEQASWQQLHILSARWQSDLIFFYDELSFLKKLLDKHLMWLTVDNNIEDVRKLISDLSKLERRRLTILQKLDLHRRHLTSLIQNPFAHDAQQCKDEHAEVEGIFTGFSKEFRQVKKEVFSLTEEIIESEKAKRLLNGQ